MDKDRIAGSAKDFAGKVESTVGNIAGDARTQAAGSVREATGTAQNLYGQAKDAARDATDAAVSYAKDAYENSGDTFRDGSQAIAKKVQDNPLGSLLVAGGIGFAMALLMTRSPRRPPPRRWRYYS
jgi:uncharacterized protein YjbJ (UPF0337 family)